MSSLETKTVYTRTSHSVLRTFFLCFAGLLFMPLAGTPLFANATPESQAAYRRSTLETLVTESQRSKTMPRPANAKNSTFMNDSNDASEIFDRAIAEA